MIPRKFTVSLLLAALLLSLAGAQAQTTYQKPPKAILDVLDAAATPLVSISPTKDQMLLAQPSRYPSIAELAEPMLRLAGLRINPKTNGQHRPARIVALTLKNIADGKEIKLEVPANAALGFPAWSPDGRHFAVTNTVADGIELWIGSVDTAKLRRLNGVRLNGVYGETMQWLADSKTLLCATIPAGRGPAPQAPVVPLGPTVQENYGKAAPAPTYQDLLKNEHDTNLFDYYATAQLAFINADSGKTASFGKPGLYFNLDPAPDGQHFLVTAIIGLTLTCCLTRTSRARSKSGIARPRSCTNSPACPCKTKCRLKACRRGRAIMRGVQTQGLKARRWCGSKRLMAATRARRRLSAITC